MIAASQQGGGREVVVVGAGIGGLSLAMLLQAKGCKVTVLEKYARAGGRANLIEEKGFRFDTGPSLVNYPWVFREVFETAGLSFDDYVTLVPVDPSVQFQWPDGTCLALSPDAQRLREEFEALEPECAANLFDFLADSEAQRDYLLA